MTPPQRRFFVLVCGVAAIVLGVIAVFVNAPQTQLDLFSAGIGAAGLGVAVSVI